MISDVAVCNEQGGNELRIIDTAAYTPAYTEILNGGGKSLEWVIRCWPLLPEHVRQTIVLLIESAVPAVAGGLGHE